MIFDIVVCTVVSIALLSIASEFMGGGHHDR